MIQTPLTITASQQIPAPIVYARKVDRSITPTQAARVIINKTWRCSMWMLSSIDAGLLATTLGGVFWLLARIAYGPAE
jgi:hypothetical protein